MTYEDKEIKTIIEGIRENRIYLPAIQRKLVWKNDQIEKLFDSIMRGYPIGTFLFWKLKGESIHDYTFYKFIQEYREKRTKNEVAPKPELKQEIIGVLDGQQRLNSMYIALQGSYAYKKPHARWDNPSAFPKRNFYLNLLYSKDDPDKLFKCPNCSYDKLLRETSKCPSCGTEFKEMEENDTEYEFKFLTEKEMSQLDAEHFWFPIKEVLLWKDVTSADDYFEECIEKNLELKKILEYKEKKKLFKNNLVLVWQRIVKDKIISFFQVEEQDLDNILAIFVRVNSGGTILSKTDLLFSTIVANWEQGRDEVEALIETINEKGEKFDFNNDFVMRMCLVLTDCNVLFKVKTFKGENIKKIKNQWTKIKNSIEKAIDLIVEFGFNRDNLTSHMAVIPIAYFIMKKEDNYRLDQTNKELIRAYLITALLKQIYGGQGDQVLGKIRDLLRKEVKKDDLITYVSSSDDFPLDLIKKSSLPANKSLGFDKQDVEDILEYQKGPYTFMVLSLLYPDLKFGQVKFHQDHIHPSSLFSYSKLNKIGIPDEKISGWQENKDKIANLQLLEGSENETKSKTPLKEWFDKQVKNKKEYMEKNYFPENVSMEITNFDEFYSKRREILRKRIMENLI